MRNCEDRHDGFYQSCQGCDVYVECKDRFTKDNIPCQEVNGNKTYWNQDKRNCTAEKSHLCNLETEITDDNAKTEEPIGPGGM